MYPRDEAIARRCDIIYHLANSLRGLDQFYLYLAQSVIGIFVVLFILSVGLLGRYTDIEYPCQKIYYSYDIIFYGMVKVYP